MRQDVLQGSHQRKVGSSHPIASNFRDLISPPTSQIQLCGPFLESVQQTALFIFASSRSSIIKHQPFEYQVLEKVSDLLPCRSFTTAPESHTWEKGLRFRCSSSFSLLTLHLYSYPIYLLHHAFPAASTDRNVDIAILISSQALKYSRQKSFPQLVKQRKRIYSLPPTSSASKCQLA